MKQFSVVHESTQVTQAPRDSDCACSSSTVEVLSQFQEPDIAKLRLLMPIAFVQINERFTISHSPHSMNGSLLLDRETLSAVKAAPEGLMEVPEELVWLLVRFGILGSDDTKLIPTQPKILEVWLHLTNACNLNCSYCYVNKSSQHMSYETGIRAIEKSFLTAKAHGFARIKLKYAGGEPTICFPQLKALHNHALTYSNQSQIPVDAVLLTNGTLLSPVMIAELKELNINLTISLDGLGAVHDNQRPFVNGAGSYTRIIERLQAVLAESIIPFVTITVTNQSVKDLKNIVGWLMNQDIPFTLNFERYSNAQGSVAQLESTSAIDSLLAALDVIEERLPPIKLLDGLIDRANLSTPHLHTCGVGRNYLVVNQLGGISKCQMQVHRPIGTIDHADLITLIKGDTTGIRNISVEEKTECQTCVWRYWCAGGCPLQTYASTGRYDVKSPNCDIYKAIYPRMLRIEGLRLLKYGVSHTYSSD